MGNIVYKTAPKRNIDEYIRSLKDIIQSQHIQMEAIKHKTLIYVEEKEQSEFIQLNFFDYEDDDECRPALQTGDIIEIMFLPTGDEKDNEYFNSIPFIAIITMRNLSWGEETVYKALQVNASRFDWGESRINNDFTFTQDQINLDEVKVKLIVRPNPTFYAEAKVYYEEYTNEWV